MEINNLSPADRAVITYAFRNKLDCPTQIQSDDSKSSSWASLPVKKGIQKIRVTAFGPWENSYHGIYRLVIDVTSDSEATKSQHFRTRLVSFEVKKFEELNGNGQNTIVEPLTKCDWITIAFPLSRSTDSW